MNKNITDFVLQYERDQFATSTGRAMHKKLQNVSLAPLQSGDIDLIEKIKNSDALLQSFFMENSIPEVPIAGYINGVFMSRRIDRLVIDDATKIVRVLDYKTDTDTEKFRAKYIAQLHEYMNLMSQIYPDYKISGYILWLHDWRLENI